MSSVPEERFYCNNWQLKFTFCVQRGMIIMSKKYFIIIQFIVTVYRASVLKEMKQFLSRQSFATKIGTIAA